MAIYRCEHCDFTTPTGPDGLVTMRNHEREKHSGPKLEQMERNFSVLLAVQIDAFGLPESHRSTIIAKVTREMELCFGGRAHVQEIGQEGFGGVPNPQTWVLGTSVVPVQVHFLGEEASVPEVQEPPPATGS